MILMVCSSSSQWVWGWRCDLAPWGTFDIGDTFHCHSWESSIGIWCVEARDAAKHLMMHRTTLYTKHYLVQSVNSTGIEKLWSGRKLDLTIERSNF